MKAPHHSRRAAEIGRIALALCTASIATSAAHGAPIDEAISTSPAAPPIISLGAQANDPEEAPNQHAGVGTAAPSESMVINLMRLLVTKGVITQDQSDTLEKQAQDEALQARAAATAPTLATASPPPQGVIRVPYVPEVVRNQIKADIKKDVLAQVQAEGWANPRVLPEWLGRVHWFGDVRFRDQFDFFSKNNATSYIDFSTFNAIGPVDVNASTDPNGLPFLDTRTDRLNQLSIRARAGVNVDIFRGVQATIRLASGSDNSPVSTTQLLGGGFTKKDIWLDQAYITLEPSSLIRFDVGRHPDLYYHTNLLFDDNLNFDGVTATGSYTLGDKKLKIFGAAGVYPLDYVPVSFPNYSSDKTGDSSKWFFAGQFGAHYQPSPSSWSLTGAVAYYDFYNVAGQLSAPCDTYNNVRQCSTDSSRPSFMQKGNTLFLIRDITPNPSSPLNYAQPQFAGLSYDYREVDALAGFEFPMFAAMRGLFEGEYVRNLAYDPARILSNPATQPITNFSDNGVYKSGPNGWMARFTFGNLYPAAKGDWNVAAGYRYTEPDAVIDAFNYNDFYMGGTNVKGYTIAFNYFFANNTWLAGRWLSGNEVFGLPLAIDILQLELNTKF